MKYRIEQAVLRAVFGFFSSLEPVRRLRWGRKAGRIWYSLDRKHRLLAVDNIERSLGLERKEAEEMALTAFRNIAATLAEFSSFDTFDDLVKNVSVEGLSHLTEAMKKGGGAFLVGGHYGNWELGAAVLARSVPLTAVVRPMKNPLADRLINERRGMGGVRVMNHRNSTRRILGKISRGEAVGILLDQSASRRESVFVPFLGRPTTVNFGLALLASKTGAPVLPVFSIRREGGRHVVRVGQPIDIVRLPDRQEELGINTARITAVLEQHIRRYPDQWFWVHNRWKNQPRPGERIYTP
jgi:KDO2-lipid IV(A) lauroyltransferase